MPDPLLEISLISAQPPYSSVHRYITVVGWSKAETTFFCCACGRPCSRAACALPPTSMSIYIRAAPHVEMDAGPTTAVENSSTHSPATNHTFADPPSPQRPAGIITSQFDQTKIPGSMVRIARIDCPRLHAYRRAVPYVSRRSRLSHEI